MQTTTNIISLTYVHLFQIWLFCLSAGPFNISQRLTSLNNKSPYSFPLNFHIFLLINLSQENMKSQQPM